MAARRFWSSLVFAAGAAVVAPLAWLVLETWLAPATAAAAVVAGLAVAHGVAIAPSARQRVGAALLSGALSLGLVALAGSLSEVVFGAAVIIGLCRAAYLYELPTGRAVLIEAALLCASLAVCRLLVDPGTLAGAAAVWGFFLVQSTYFLLAPGPRRVCEATEGDRFEMARERLEELLQDGPA